MKPFLKWPGNKYQIIEKIREKLPSGIRLIEPFLGSGSIFLNTEYSSYLSADANQDLIQLYQLIQKEGAAFISFCKEFFIPKNTEQKRFLELRSLFNQSNDSRLKSALFLYLNKHSYNGLCRYNQKREFNAPFGYYKKTYFPEKELYYFYEKSTQASFICCDFLTSLNDAKQGDVIYCDPPYVPLSKTANFTNYSAGGFTESQHILLANRAIELAASGIPVLISNHDTPFTQETYQLAKLSYFQVQRYISRDGSTRGKARELLAIFS